MKGLPNAPGAVIVTLPVYVPADNPPLTETQTLLEAEVVPEAPLDICSQSGAGEVTAAVKLRPEGVLATMRHCAGGGVPEGADAKVKEKPLLRPGTGPGGPNGATYGFSQGPPPTTVIK
jgi:hypothetical protein